MSRFTDQEEIRQLALKRSSQRRGESFARDEEAARARLRARKEGGKNGNVSEGAHASATAREGKRFFLFSNFLMRFASNRRAVLVVIVLVVISLFLCAYFFGMQQTPATSTSPDADTSEQNSTSDVSVVDSLQLPAYLPDQLKADLIAQAHTNEDMARIAYQAEAYGIDGPEVQQKILKLAVDEPAARPFVLGFLDSYPASTGSPYTESLTKGDIPLLQQWDPRWGYLSYSSAPFGLTGCCPTAFSMVCMGLTGNPAMTPAEMGALASRDGYMDEFRGTDASFLVNEAPNFGLFCNSIPVDADTVRQCLGAGEVIICNVGPGDFTLDGHFFVIVGLNADGTVKINDPYSKVRSDKPWDINVLMNQTRALYSCGTA